MSKAYKSKTCVYCLSRDSEDGDHVISRNFFVAEKREGIPKVPACKACNNAKSQLEHYLTAVLPFGGRHADASRTVSQMVPPRLAKNAKLFDRLKSGWKSILRWRGQGQWVEESVLPFDSEHLVRYMEMVVKGLAWHHWKLLFTADHIVQASFVNEEGSRLLDNLFKAKAKSRVKENMGEGTFMYEAAQSTECDEFTVWRLSIYGLEAGDDPRAPLDRSSVIYAITSPRSSRAAAAALHLMVGPVKRGQLRT
jgi:hypothetical protein